MKFLGHTDNECLVSLTKKELANLLGSHYEDDVKWNSFKMGHSLDIHETWNSLIDLGRSKTTLKRMSKDLHEIANQIDARYPEIKLTNRND